jgi:putative transposase
MSLPRTQSRSSALHSLRFQIKFNFCDAKQFSGLKDFMNITPAAVTNAANFAFGEGIVPCRPFSVAPGLLRP